MQTNLRTYLRRSRPSAGTSSLLGVAALALAGSAVLVNRRAAQAELDYLPKGRFVTVDGVRLHYVEKGTGPPVVFLHGNGAMAEDMLISDVIMTDLNGIDAAIKIRSLLPSCKILLFSGQAATADLLDRARVQGHEFEILAKPVHPQDLLVRLRS